jgi:hypothetical protein
MNTELAAGLGVDVRVLLRLLYRYKEVNKYEMRKELTICSGNGCKKSTRLRCFLGDHARRYQTEAVLLTRRRPRRLSQPPVLYPIPRVTVP